MAEARTPRRRTGKADPETDEVIYQAILRAIMEGKLKAGTKLVENPLATYDRLNGAQPKERAS